MVAHDDGKTRKRKRDLLEQLRIAEEEIAFARAEFDARARKLDNALADAAQLIERTRRAIIEERAQTPAPGAPR